MVYNPILILLKEFLNVADKEKFTILGARPNVYNTFAEKKFVC